MDSYTLNTFDHTQAMIQALPDHFDMSLNPHDMATVIDALSHTADMDTADRGHAGSCQDRALDLLSSISETLGIEGI